MSSSSVTSLPSDGIPTTLNYVCREAPRDDPTSDTKSEIDQTEVTDVQSVTTVPMEPPLITENAETKTTYVDYVRGSIISLWKHKEPTQVEPLENNQYNQSESVVQLNDNRSTDKTTPDNVPHKVGSTISSHKTELVDIECDSTATAKAVENIEGISEDNQRNIQVQSKDNFDNVRTYTANRVSEQMSSETGESLVPVTVNSSSRQSNVTHSEPDVENENEAQSLNHIYQDQSPLTERTPKKSESVARSPQTSTSVLNEHNGHVSPTNTRLPGAIVTKVEQRKQAPNPPPPIPLDDDDQIRRTVHMADSSRPSAIIVHQGEQDDAVEYRPTITGWASPRPQVATASTPDEPLAEADEWFDPSSKSDSDEFDPTQQKMSDQFIPEEHKMPSRPIDDDDQIRQTVHMANTSRPSAVIVGRGEQADAVDYRPTITSWATPPPQLVTTPDQPFTEADESSNEFDPAQQRESALVRRNSARPSDSDEFGTPEKRLTKRRRTLKTSNITIAEDEAEMNVQPAPRRQSQSRMRHGFSAMLVLLVNMANHLIILDMSLFDNI